MSYSSHTNIRLRTALNRTFSQEARSRSNLKNRQADELKRLKDICFPHKADRKHNQSVDYHAFLSKNENTLPRFIPRDNNRSVLVERGRHSFMNMPENSSFIAHNASNMSFNMSPLSNKHNQSDEKENSGFFEADKSNVFDKTHKNPEVSSTSFLLKPVQNDSDAEYNQAKKLEDLSTITNHFSSEMIRFITALTNNMKSVCLTKMSEKNLQILLNRYLTRLESVQSQWHRHLASDEDFRAGTKNLVNILSNCFEEILGKLSDLLYKLKTFDDVDFNPLETQGVLSTMITVLQQDHTLTSHQVLLEGLQTLSKSTRKLTAIRLGLIFKPKVANQKLHALTMIKLFAVKKQSSPQTAASNILNNVFQRKVLLNKADCFKLIQAASNEKFLGQEIIAEEGLKNLLSSLIKSTDNESNLFNIINTFLSAFTKCKNCEFLVLDKNQQTAYGYLFIKSQESQTQRGTGEQNNLSSERKDPESQETLLTFFDKPFLTEETFSEKIHLSYETESLLKYVITKKDTLYSWNLPHISLYNREVDVPLILKDQMGQVSTYRRSRFEKFMYFPLCAKNSSDVLGLIRIFFAPDENIDISPTLQKLQRFSNTLTPLVEYFLRIQRMNFTKESHAIHENVIKKLVNGSIEIINNTYAASTPKIYQLFSELLFDLFHLQKITLSRWNEKGKVVPFYINDPFKRSKPGSLNATAQKSAATLQISLQDPISGDLVGLIELEGSHDHKEKDWDSPAKDYLSKRTPRLESRYDTDNVPQTIISFISTFGFHVFEKASYIEQNPHYQSGGSLNEVKHRNSTLERRISLHEALHTFNAKIQNCSSYKEVTGALNEVIKRSKLDADFGGLFFVNSANKTYFTFHEKSDPEDLLIFSKHDSLLGSLLEKSAHSIQPILINYPDTLPPTSAQKKASSPYKLSPDSFSKSKTLKLDLDREDILIQFPLKQISPPSRKRNEARPQTAVILPIKSTDMNAVAHLVFAKSSNGKVLDDEEDYFAHKLADTIGRFLSAQQKLSETVSLALEEREKAQITKSKMKAYQALVMNPIIQPEYKIYKKHKNLQSFVSFLEKTFCQLLKAKSARILLYNSPTQSLYYFPQATSVYYNELTEPLNRSITGISMLKNQVFVYPQLPTENPQHTGSFIQTAKQGGFDLSLSHNFNSWKQDSNTLANTDTLSGLPLSLMSPHASNIPPPDLRENPDFNSLVDSYEESQRNSNIREVTLSFKKKFRETQEPSSHTEKIQSFLCLPIYSAQKEIIGAVQIFGKQDSATFFQNKDIVKAQTIIESIVPKLQKYLKNPQGIYSQAFTKGFDRFIQILRKNRHETLAPIMEKLKVHSFLTTKSGRRFPKEDIVKGLQKIFRLTRTIQRSSFETVKLHYQMEKFLSFRTEATSRDENIFSKKMASTKFFYTIDRIIRRILTAEFTHIKISENNNISMNMSDETENTRLRTGELQNFMARTQDSKALSESLETNPVLILKYKYFFKVFGTIVQEPLHRDMNDAFTKIREYHANDEQQILQGLLDRFKLESLSLKSFLLFFSEYIKSVFNGCLSCNIALVDTISEKLFCFNEKSVPDFSIGFSNKKQIKNLERIIENKLTKVYDTKPIFELNQQAKLPTKFACIQYLIVDLNDFMPPGAEFEDLYLLAEIVSREEVNAKISQQSKDIIKSLFVRSALSSKANLSLLAALHKRCLSNAIHRAFYDWKIQTKQIKNQQVVGETSQAFKAVEQQLVTVEEDMKRYQQEIAEYDHKVKHLTQELQLKGGQCIELDSQIEQTILEKKAKTKCLSVSLMFNLFFMHNSQKLQTRTSFHKWKSLATRAKLSSNVIAKMANVNRRHLSARFQASFLILEHRMRKYCQRLLLSSFKTLLASSVLLSPMQKSLVSGRFLMSSVESKGPQRSVTPDKIIQQRRSDPLKIPYLPLRSTSQPRSHAERDQGQGHQLLQLDLNARHNRNLDNDFLSTQKLPENSQVVFGEGNSLRSSLGAGDEFFSRSPKRRSFMQYQENLLKSNEKPERNKKPAMSEKTKNFFNEFEANKLLKNKRNRAENLNKSDIGLIGSKQTSVDESLSSQNYRFYNKPINNSFNGDDNWNDKIILRHDNSFL